MSWLARSIANSLKFEDDDQQPDKNTTTSAGTTDNVSNNKDFSNPKSDQQQSATPRGVKEDLTDLKQTLTRQLWGVASFLAPPPEPPLTENRSHSSDPDGSNDADADAEDDAALIDGIRSDFAEIGGRFKSGISKLSSNKTVSEFTKIASNLLQLGSESDEIETTVSAAASAVGVTEEVVGFARDVAMHPETWLDFPLPDVQAFEDFDMSDAQQEHALAVEHLAPRLAALRIELCPGYMSEGCFWKIYFVLLHPRLSKHDAELLSTPQIVEARAMLSHELQNKTKAKSTPDWSGVGTFNVKDTADLPHEESLTVPSRAKSESVPITTSGMEAVSPTLAAETFDDEAAPSIVSEGKVDQTKHQHSPSSSSSGVLEEKFDDDGDDWLKDDSSEMIGVSGPSMPLGNDEDVSFSDLEEDDGDEPASVKKVASGSDCAGKGSQDWVQLSRSSSDSVKDIKPVSIKKAGSEKVSARNSENKESSEWLDVDDIDVM
ncbi:BSD DOMAIN-CONTAINING PROTEIN-RELATED [Salix viminalis]|uniref:BSD DOMAIN-CONTAINING PROTEIN-RELATED n=1 Tax=Salix viminalis TaxID=40686 RepID=A0A9Q0SGA5_SALVM|nr:BSD DOMAIN-CONTAINING PROTEIN-RELATED [Salix viminalis]